MEILRKCPFCGKSVASVDTIANHGFIDEDDVRFDYSSTHFDVCCNYNLGGCGASTGKHYASPEEAIAAWNASVDE